MQYGNEDQIDLKRLEIEIRNKLAQEHNWKQQEELMHDQRGQLKRQVAHWENQGKYWIAAVVLMATALILNFFKDGL